MIFDGAHVTESTDREVTVDDVREAITEPVQLPEWMVAVLRAMIEGKRLIVPKARVSAFREFADQFPGVVSDDFELIGSPYLPDASVIIYDPEDVEPLDQEDSDD